MLDMEALSLDQIADLILDNMISSGHLEASGREKVREALLRRHRHLHEKVFIFFEILYLIQLCNCITQLQTSSFFILKGEKQRCEQFIQ